MMTLADFSHKLAEYWNWLTQTPVRTLCVYAVIIVAVFFMLMVADSLYEEWQKRSEKR